MKYLALSKILFLFAICTWASVLAINEIEIASSRVSVL